MNENGDMPALIKLLPFALVSIVFSAILIVSINEHYDFINNNINGLLVYSLGALLSPIIGYLFYIVGAQAYAIMDLKHSNGSKNIDSVKKIKILIIATWPLTGILFIVVSYTICVFYVISK